MGCKKSSCDRWLCICTTSSEIAWISAYMWTIIILIIYIVYGRAPPIHNVNLNRLLEVKSRARQNGERKRPRFFVEQVQVQWRRRWIVGVVDSDPPFNTMMQHKRQSVNYSHEHGVLCYSAKASAKPGPARAQPPRKVRPKQGGGEAQVKRTIKFHSSATEVAAKGYFILSVISHLNTT